MNVSISTLISGCCFNYVQAFVLNIIFLFFKPFIYVVCNTLEANAHAQT